jgi:hypothetical protein
MFVFWRCLIDLGLYECYFLRRYDQNWFAGMDASTWSEGCTVYGTASVLADSACC